MQCDCAQEQETDNWRQVTTETSCAGSGSNCLNSQEMEEVEREADPADEREGSRLKQRSERQRCHPRGNNDWRRQTNGFGQHRDS